MLPITTECVLVGLVFQMVNSSNVAHQSRPRASIPGCMSSFTQQMAKIARTCFCTFLVCFTII